jgi:hypothetical protein
MRARIVIWIAGIGAGCGSGGTSAPDAPAVSTPDAPAVSPPDAATVDAPSPVPDAAHGVTFRVTVPDNTPPEALVFIRTGPLDLPLAAVGGDVWQTSVPTSTFSGFSNGTNLPYAYHLGLGYDGGEFFAGDPTTNSWYSGRIGQAHEGDVNVDTVARWRWFPPPGTPVPTMSATVTTIAPRAGGAAFQAGVELVDYGSAAFAPLIPGTAEHLKSVGVGWAQLAPPWDYAQVDPLPVVVNDPTKAQYTDDELRGQTMALRAAGMKVTFRPQVCCTFQGDTSGKSAAWWDAWFATYQAFLVHHAQIAADTGVDQIFLQDLRFAYPGNPQAAADAEARWRKLMPAVRAVYHGAIGQQLGIIGSPGDNALPGNWPYVEPIDDLFDFYAVSIFKGVTTSATASQGQLDAGMETLFAQSFDAVHAQSTRPLLGRQRAIRELRRRRHGRAGHRRRPQQHLRPREREHAHLRRHRAGDGVPVAHAGRGLAAVHRGRLSLQHPLHRRAPRARLVRARQGRREGPRGLVRGLREVGARARAARRVTRRSAPAPRPGAGRNRPRAKRRR